ncbi:MAG: hypothetical protein IPN89_16070 [Saprospiraceae bacterium]|nr:hypothetical protein [Saprospiraceae bacterium]
MKWSMVGRGKSRAEKHGYSRNGLRLRCSALSQLMERLGGMEWSRRGHDGIPANEFTGFFMLQMNLEAH